MEKVFIKNRKGQKMAVVVEGESNAKGLAFVMHGLSGNKEEPHIQTFAQAFREATYTVVLFDTTNTFGESEGKYEDATITNYYEDVEDVIKWSQGQSWYQEPFDLAGHSLGGICIALYAQKYPEKVKALAPISTVISGQLSLSTDRHRGIIEEWKRTGWRVEESTTRPGLIKRTPWSHMEDRLKYDLLPQAHKLTMPVLMIVGENDTGCPLEHQRLLFDKLPGQKELHVIKGAPHTFQEPEHLEEIKRIFKKWINNLPS